MKKKYIGCSEQTMEMWYVADVCGSAKDTVYGMPNFGPDRLESEGVFYSSAAK